MNNGLVSYAAFLKTKIPNKASSGIAVNKLPSYLYDFQEAICRWALEKGRAAVFTDCGTGKSPLQLSWAKEIGGTCLIVAPLSVAEQTQREGKKFGVKVTYVKTQQELSLGINITNYERIKSFNEQGLDSIVCDESSILKSLEGRTKEYLLESFNKVPYKLCCTATPCPNDIAELANHCEFLQVMTRAEMLASFFVHDEEGWRLRGHAAKPFYRWLATWAMAMKNPSDLGFDGSRFVLPKLNILPAIVPSTEPMDGMLFPGPLRGIQGRIKARKTSLQDRVAMTAKLANEAKGQVIVWCGLNTEAEACAKLIPNSRNIQGSDPTDQKKSDILDFIDGKYHVMITKPKIAGFGLNLQNASTAIFCGLGDSYESYYQCIRRSWRYGQKNPVNVYIVISEFEEQILENVKRKEREAEKLSASIIEGAKEFEKMELGKKQKAETMGTAVYKGEDWKLYQGDAVEEAKKIPESSIDLSVFSPPFLSLYTYSASEKDIGNCKNNKEFFEHFSFLIKELLRVTKPGRLCCVHCALTATTLANDGVIGLKDFPGDVIRQFVKQEWIFQGEVVIQKNPQVQAIRTHSKGLLFAQLKKDASWLRPGLSDQILVFRKPGENATPIHPDITNEEWISWAHPVWFDIRESDTLNTKEGKDSSDDRHICALQLGTIERCVRLWSNPGETVFSPFAGIGSEGFVALQQSRKFIGVELKPLYASVACKNLKVAKRRLQGNLLV
jgi:DNA modification methylase